MSKRAPAIHRIYQPLKPCNSVILVDSECMLALTPDKITIDNVGLKAFGLVSIPQAWIKPFFVISGNATPSPENLSQALQSIGICLSDRVIVRSSGIDESIDQ